VIVVGGGHAGFEAALAAARLGAETLLVTGDPERVCTLACNPSIGGSAKGQLVREIDALGGEMARVADATSLHARFLNESKGPSVRALRVLADKPGYVRAARAVLARTPNLTIVSGMAEDLLLDGNAVAGVVLGDGRALRAAAAIDPQSASYRDSYQTTAIFLSWIEVAHTRDFVKKMNAFIRQGQYDDALFKKLSGRSLDALWEEFRAVLPGKY